MPINFNNRVICKNTPTGFVRVILNNPQELVRKCPAGFCSSSSLTCGTQKIPVINLTKEKKAAFNSISARLGNNYYRDIVETKYNIFLTKKEREATQKIIDADFRADFMRETKDIFSPELSYEAGEIMQKSIAEQLTVLDDVFKIPESKAYMKTAKGLEKATMKLFGYEETITAMKKELQALKEDYIAATDEKAKIKAAKKYNALADKHNKAVEKYNVLLTGKYTDMTKEQIERRQKIKKEFSDKTLFYMLYGKNDPKMPITARKGN